MSENLVEAARGRTPSVIDLAQRLVRAPSRGGIDPYEPVLAIVEDWLNRHHLPHRRLNNPAADPVALVVEVAGAAPGPWWTLDACLDTAPFGDETAWSFPPTSGDVKQNWLLGRGSADSKLAAATFCHIAADVHARAHELAGGLVVLLDVDEHTGHFGGALAYLDDPHTTRPEGVMIGYPGMDEVVVGGRGLWRAQVKVHGASGHSGSSRPTLGAISRAAHLIHALDNADLPDPADGDPFPLPPKVSVTACHGGEGFSVVPDLCTLNIDIRLTPAFGEQHASQLVHAATEALDRDHPTQHPTQVDTVAVWPPFQLGPGQEPAATLLRAAKETGLEPRPKTAGPSNIGNLLARHGIAATAGFGVPYEGLHGIDERAHLTELPHVYAIYHQTVLDLLRPS
ncbi:M20/M25/M40 family metallo-hydrolase [Kitasatospora sp. GP82]|uniref:M20 family metallopeptidase n=1 Tax=Kitasatospora sp. GP82 TaxID=3035089 RepID=UPI002475A141|nr:M20/M25/M40 family metallo-hydrolase [Kitasatospora sp. GP82]MDH6130248.1 succinyl-diaminopimelate desuccinylase [Kitasatospora sp. GP82]